MKAISVKQPWAWLIIRGWKPIENRTWQTSYRGELYIHASKGFDLKGYKWIQETFPLIPLPKRKEFKRGGIIGQVRLADILNNAESPWADPGNLYWKLENPRDLPFVECNGTLRLWQPTQETINNILKGIKDEALQV